MDGSCLKCGAPLSTPWSFCPKCGAAITPAIHAEHEPAERAPVKEAFSGLYLGMIVGPAMVIVGGMLCLTGLGAFLGVPLIIGGILAPVAGPMVGMTSLKGNCPWCGAKVSSLNAKGSFDCEACHKRVAVRDHRFVPAA
jgi:DNA-directed RNA polymerase subunit RPC12/RpoP